jgi:hypothetical protein
MNRLAAMIAVVFTATVIGSSGPAIAFSLNWVQSQAIDTYGTAQIANDANMPTPRFFIVSIGPKPAPATLSFASPNDGTAQPNIHTQHPGMPRQTAALSTLNRQASTTVTRLNGAELFLLRKVQTIAERE